MDERRDLLRVSVAQVEHLERRAQLARGDDAVDDVRDVGEVALQLRAICLPVLGEGLPLEDVLGEGEVGHVGPGQGRGQGQG